MIFGHSVAESKKAVIAFILFGGSIAALFVAYNPEVNQVAISIAGAVFGIIGVFTAPQFSIEDLSKWVAALQGSVIAMANFWVAVSPSLTVKITTAVGAALGLFAIYMANNKKEHNVVNA